LVTLEEIIENCKKYDVTAQRLLYERYANQLRNICTRYISDNHDIKDIVHDSFIKIFSKIKQYNHKGTFEGWMVRILINTAIKHLKKKKPLNFDNIDNFESSIPDSDSYLIIEEKFQEDILNDYHSIEQMDFTQQELMEIIMKIPESYRIVFSLFHLEEYGHEEIANLLGIDVNNSRIRLHRARNIIREALVKRAKEMQSTKLRMP
jgi:RNA polymerase sigma factor (sigma-70 family)